MKIGEAYGDESTNLMKSISSSGMMFIAFQYGFPEIFGLIDVKALININGIELDCQTWLDTKRNILKSPDRYNVNLNCSWLLTSNVGSYIILHFDNIHVSSKTRPTLSAASTYSL